MLERISMTHWGLRVSHAVMWGWACWIRATLHPEKQLTSRHGTLAPSLMKGGQEGVLRGYEIHCGISTGKAMDNPAVYLDGQPEGAISTDGQILATYLHGLFDAPEALQALLAWAGLHTDSTFDINDVREQQLERLADTLETHLNMKLLLRASGLAKLPQLFQQHRGIRARWQLKG